MSTRAHIIIEKTAHSTAYVYHHCDGYPEGVGEELCKFVIDHNKEMSLWTPKGFATQLSEYDDSYEPDDGIHGDEEYIYVVDLDKSITVGYEIWGDEFETCRSSNKLEEHRCYQFDFNITPTPGLFFATSESKSTTQTEEGLIKYLQIFAKAKGFDLKELENYISYFMLANNYGIGSSEFVGILRNVVERFISKYDD